MDTIFFEIALTFYLLAAVMGAIELFRSNRGTTITMYFLAGIGFLFHTISLVSRYAEAAHLPMANPHEASSFFSWCIVLVFFVLELRHRVKLLGSFVMPIVFFMMLASSMLPRDIKPLSPVLQSYWFGIHTALAFIANAAFALACGVGIMYIVQEHFVRSKHLGDLFRRLPSLETLDETNYTLVKIGFPLFTLAIITGMFWANSAWGSFWRWDPREVWALVTWFIYSIIIHARYVAGWRGKRAAVLSIVGFATILIAFFGVKLLQKGLHVFP